MPFRVICHGCRTIFEVQEKDAGRSGPCPKCKTIITIPDADQAIPADAPVIIGDRGGFRGEELVKPIARKAGKLTPLGISLIAGAAIGILLATWIGGRVGLFKSFIPCALGLILISPLLVLAAYLLLRDEELEPYQGKEFYVRAGICGAVYALLWGAFAYLNTLGFLGGEFVAWNWIVAVPPLVVLGALAAHATLDLDLGNSFFHYCFYVLITIFLQWLSGNGWIWNL
jgi:hypothetical protein